MQAETKVRTEAFLRNYSPEHYVFKRLANGKLTARRAKVSNQVMQRFGALGSDMV